MILDAKVDTKVPGKKIPYNARRVRKKNVAGPELFTSFHVSFQFFAANTFQRRRHFLRL